MRCEAVSTRSYMRLFDLIVDEYLSLLDKFGREDISRAYEDKVLDRPEPPVLA